MLTQEERDVLTAVYEEMSAEELIEALLRAAETAGSDEQLIEEYRVEAGLLDRAVSASNESSEMYDRLQHREVAPAA